LRYADTTARIYNSARDDRARTLEIGSPVRRRVVECNNSAPNRRCVYEEILNVDLVTVHSSPTEQKDAQFVGITFKLFSQSGNEIIIRVPPQYFIEIVKEATKK
jgi:hypothetical protein